MKSTEGEGVFAGIFAGGQSQRMGQDKSLMFDNVERLRRILLDMGCENIFILCGDLTRAHHFQPPFLCDPEPNMGMHELVIWLTQTYPGTWCFMPCDSFLFDMNTCQEWLSAMKTGCVPLDRHGQRQPLFSIVPDHVVLNKQSQSMLELTQQLPELIVSNPVAFTNFNTNDEIYEHIDALTQLHGTVALSKWLQPLEGTRDVLQP